MHFIQTSDWHLGRLLFEHSLLEDQKHVLDQLYNQIKKAEDNNTPYDGLLIPGDIYDRANPPKEAMQVLSDFLWKLSQDFKYLNIFILSGNHDDPKLLYFAKDFFRLGNVHICTDLSDFQNPVILTDSKGEQAAVYQLPYLEAYSFTDLRRQQEMYEEACKKITEYHNQNHSDKLSIVCVHLFTIQATAEDSERSSIGPAEEVDADLFSSFNYTAAGHIHSFQPCGNKKNMYYSGSPLKYNPDNKDRGAKYFLDINVTEEKVELEKIPVNPLHQIKLIEGNYKDYYGPESKPELIEPYKNDYIVFTCTDDVPPDSPMVNLKKVFPNIRIFRMKQKERNENQSTIEERRKLIESVETNPEQLFEKFLEDINAQIQDKDLQNKEKELFLSYIKKEKDL